ncbi:MAG: cyclic 2,3-diphosphoglycerate synthase [Candidatus Bathyarchaeota archaeon]|jgi:predicted GTPase
MMVKKAIIMGAAGRDFHNFNSHFRGNPDYEVVAFTAAQISELDAEAGVETRVYPPELAGDGYPEGIKIYSETLLEELIVDLSVDDVVFSYSDVSHGYVMDKASRVLAVGANFVLLGTNSTMLASKKPVISVCASRTGSGKSPTSRWLMDRLWEKGYEVVVIRHPMPYGNLSRQRVQRFETIEDLDKHDCTIEEREDYEPHLERGAIVFAGVDYGEILMEAEKEAEIILWDGGNNDFPFYRPTVHVVMVDPHRAGDELSYYPGETNVRMADIVIISKVNTADPDKVEESIQNVREINQDAEIIKANISITAERDEDILGKKVLAVEDGPTVTHGGMSYGAASIKARALEAELVDPRPYSKGTIKTVFEMYPHLENVLPAIGYSEHQMEELSEVINSTPCDLVLLGTPTDISRYLKVNKPVQRVRYELEEIVPGEIEDAIFGLLEKRLNV